MAFKQERAIALIDAGLDFRNALYKLATEITNYAQTIYNNPQNSGLAQEMAAEIIRCAQRPDYFLTNSLRAESILQYENNHFRLNFKKNQANREYKRDRDAQSQRPRRKYRHQAGTTLPEIYQPYLSTPEDYHPPNRPLSPESITPDPLPLKCPHYLCDFPGDTTHCGVSADMGEECPLSKPKFATGPEVFKFRSQHYPHLV